MEKQESLSGTMGRVKLEAGVETEAGKLEDSSVSTPHGSKQHSRSSSLSPNGVKARSESVSTPDSTTQPKITRKTSQKGSGRPAPLFAHLPDATQESTQNFQVINDCLYGSKYMGSTDHEPLDCDCTEEWRDDVNHACGEDSDCINRATKMECVDGDCNCGSRCQNQRFQRKQYADVSVIKTEKKGYGLRANNGLSANDFIFEYIGEVINEPTFRRRMIQYDKEGIKHFYFMSLTKSEFVDATRKGNLGRFCNHSCNPNCYVDKWVVGEKLRMGIFAGRNIKPGEELVFNYNVDRYGADPQPCYCGEPNCTGFIGGKTQTERATKLPLATIEALGIDDGDDWDTTVAKRPRKKKTSEDDEEYVNSIQPSGLTEEGVTKVMAALMQCKEKWIAVKLLARIQDAEDERVLHRIVRMHGYQILRATLNTFADDDNVVLQILDILDKFPRLTKNKIADSKIEMAVEALRTSEHEEVALKSGKLLSEWSKLETAYRIPRKKFDPSQPSAHNSFEERRAQARAEPVLPKVQESVPEIAIPKGPRSSIPQRPTGFFSAPRPRRPPQGHNLPSGWFLATDPRGNTYYYTKGGQTTWQRPSTPAIEMPKGPTKAQQDRTAVQEIIDSLTRETPRPSTSLTPQRPETPAAQEPRKEKWRSLPIEKQQRIYENTLFPHVKSVMDRYRHKLPKEEIKKFAKEINKKLVASDYKNNRVDDPTRISAKQEKKIKSYVKEFFDKAVLKYQAHQRRRAQRSENHASDGSATVVDDVQKEDVITPVDDPHASDGEGASPASSGKKRKRVADEEAPSPHSTPDDPPSVKRVKEDECDEPSPPPPPPPPPAEDGTLVAAGPEDVIMLQEGGGVTPTDEQAELHRLQEEALERENEEAMRDFEQAQTHQAVQVE